MKLKIMYNVDDGDIYSSILPSFTNMIDKLDNGIIKTAEELGYVCKLQEYNAKTCTRELSFCKKGKKLSLRACEAFDE